MSQVLLSSDGRSSDAHGLELAAVSSSAQSPRAEDSGGALFIAPDPTELKHAYTDQASRDAQLLLQVRQGSLDGVAFWARAGGARINHAAESGSPPSLSSALHTAASVGQAAIIGKLIELNADVLLRNRDGETALHTAVSSGRRSCVKALLDAATAAQADPPGATLAALLRVRDNGGRTAARAAVQFRQSESLTDILAAAKSASILVGPEVQSVSPTTPASLLGMYEELLAGNICWPIDLFNNPLVSPQPRPNSGTCVPNSPIPEATSSWQVIAAPASHAYPSPAH